MVLEKFLLVCNGGRSTASVEIRNGKEILRGAAVGDSDKEVAWEAIREALKNSGKRDIGPYTGTTKRVEDYAKGVVSELTMLRPR